MPFEITARSCIGTALERLIKTLAATPEIQTFLGAGDAAAAEARIHLFETPSPADPATDEYTAAEWSALHPMLVVEPPDGDNMFEANSIATGGTFTKTLVFSVKFCRIISPGSDSQSKLNLELMDILGQAVDEMISQQGQINYFWFTDVIIDKPIWRAAPRDQVNIGDRQVGWFTLAAREEVS